ncbi:Integrator complex subunit 5 [Dermatophagoides pteronyssinus]|uniref:Integrator complex subunit 5 n=1 Tax=Dermatophagoides pteronyssinus TaxID=6956 RepID=A0ABQ8JHY9_DERPT|nr:Integrator complex subunit 5 [Dermatophagoides pteronyssinus]
MYDPYKIQSSKLFFDFFHDGKIFPTDKVLDSAIYLLENGSPYRDLILEFFTTLFRECCQQYCLINSCLKQLNDIKPKKIQSNILKQFSDALNETTTTTTTLSNHRINEELIKSEPMEIIEDCPLSPPKEPIGDFDKEDLSFGNSSNNNNNMQNDLLVVMNLIERQMPKITRTLLNLLKQDHLEQNHQHVRISNWALTLATNISLDNHYLIDKSDEINLSLVKALNFWKPCSFMQILIQILFESIRMIEPSTMINLILKYSPTSDWILANLLTAMTDDCLLTQYLELLINHSSSIHILSYVSEHNPNAIANCSKSNIPFLLNLCTNSQPLLNLLAKDLIKNVNVKTMNEFAEQHQFDNELNPSNILYCILNAPNAFELLKISFNLIMDSNSSEKLIEKLLNLLESMVKQIHLTTINSMSTNTFIHFQSFHLSSQQQQQQRKDTNCLLTILRNHIEELVDFFFITQNRQLKKIQMKLINLTCINYGREFIVEVFHYLMNLPQQPTTINVGSYQNPKLNNQFLSLLNTLRIDFGYEVYDCIKETLNLQQPKKLDFWANLMIFNESKPIEFEIANLVYYLDQRFNEQQQDDHSDIIRIYYILRILIKVFDYYDEMYYQEQYRLCLTLINIYFELINIMNNDNDEQTLAIILDCLVNCQEFLKKLSLTLQLNEWIILQTILDYIRLKSNLFTNYYPIDSMSTMANNGHHNNQWPSLLNENMNCYNLKLKKNPLIPFYSAKKKQRCLNRNSSFNKRLIIDLIDDCMNYSAMFADNFTDSLSNQLLLRDAPILDEDPKDGQVQHLRMTFETDLHIYRLFDQNPILWNILQLLSQKKSLTRCLVIIRCIINVLRTNLVSSTSNENHLLDTQRFIWTMANDEILPRIPFIYIPEAINEQIKPYEVAYVLHDIAKYIRDNQSRETIQIPRPYLIRLRSILAHKKPNEAYLKIFKNL